MLTDEHAAPLLTGLFLQGKRIQVTEPVLEQSVLIGQSAAVD
jgi:hypothetical protein